jgi:hypothetical protein
MPEYLLELVTLFHPEEYLPNYRELPRIERSRRVPAAAVRSGDVLESVGPVVEVAFARRRGLVDRGVPTTRFRRRALAGKDVVRVLGEPRLVYIADEPPPRPKWKLEFARWKGTSCALPDEEAETLRSAIAARRLRINQVWVNRRRRLSDGSEIDVVNLVLGPQNAPLAPAELSFVQHGHDWFVSWK